MAPRPSWKGFLRLSLVSIPVRFYTASASPRDVQLHQLHKGCNSRIQYRKVCPLHGEVSNDEIVSGHEHTKGQYVVVEPDERESLYKESDRSVNIDAFVPPGTMDPIYYAGKNYYLLPDGPAGEKPYVLLQRSMSRKDLSAVARVVLFGREQVVLVKPIKRLLALSVLVYEDQIKKPEEFEDELGEPELTEDELRLTETLIAATTVEKFDLSRYQDQYARKLTELIQDKVEGKQISAAPDVEAPPVINLMEALKRSVAQAKGKAGEQRAVQGQKGRKMAQSSRRGDRQADQKAAARRKKKLG